MRHTIEQKRSKIIKARTAKYFLNFIDNLLAELKSFTTLFERNTSKQISISIMNQLTDNNQTRMKHLSFPAVTIGSKYLAKGSARLGNKLFAEANQVSTSIDI